MRIRSFHLAGHCKGFKGSLSSLIRHQMLKFCSLPNYAVSSPVFAFTQAFKAMERKELSFASFIWTTSAAS